MSETLLLHQEKTFKQNFMVSFSDGVQLSQGCSATMRKKFTPEIPDTHLIVCRGTKG